MHHLFYARLANKPYSVDQLHDDKVAITVCAYDEDETIASMQERMLNVDMKKELEKQYPGLRYDDMIERTYDLLSDLFGKAAASIGEWPQSSAYYSIDVIFDTSKCSLRSADGEVAQSVFDNNLLNDALTPQPKLLEVNFMGDWHGVEAAVHRREDYEQWVSDLVTVIATNDDLQEHPRLRKLRNPQQV